MSRNRKRNACTTRSAAIIGSFANSSATKPASAVARTAKKLFLRGSSAALTERDYKYFFRHAPTDAIESEEFTDYITFSTRRKRTRLRPGFMRPNGAVAADEAKKAAKKIGLEVVADVPFNNGATNLSSYVQNS